MNNGNKLPTRCIRLKELRTKHKYSQANIAQILNVTTKTYRTWEIGYYHSKSNATIFPSISCEHIEKLSDIYNVSTDYILGKSDCLSVENEEIHKLTGLNNNAIETLKFMNKNKDISTLNYIMDDSLSFSFFMSHIKYFLNGSFDTPVYFIHTNDEHCSIQGPHIGADLVKESVITPEYRKNENNIYIQNSSSEDKEFIAIPVSMTQTYFIDCIREQLILWKKQNL